MLKNEYKLALFIKKSISEEGAIGRRHSEIHFNHIFLFICDKGKAICFHFIWHGTEVWEEGGEDKLMFVQLSFANI